MDVLDAVVTDGGRQRRGRTVVAGLGVVAVLAIATAVLVALLGGTARAQTGTDPGPQPYGGQLEKVDETDRVTSEQVLEVGMLGLGTLNGMAFVVAMIASRLRGPSTAQTRRALIARTGAGVVSESRRQRRQRLRDRGADPAPAHVAPSPGVHPATPPGDRPAGGPSAQAPRTPPPGTVPAQGGPTPREGLVPTGRAPQGPPNPPHGRSAPVSPPTGVPGPIRPSVRR
jgi:hypothetical protein